MAKIAEVGRVFYGVAIAVLGFQTIWFKDFAYMLIPPEHATLPGFIILTYVSGALLLLAGTAIVFNVKTRAISVALGTALLLVFCFYFIPYQIMANPNYLQWGEWENAEKELALVAGAFVIASCSLGQDEKPFIGAFARLIPLGRILFSLTMICFGIDHFLYAKEVIDYVPAWVPWHLFWIYLGGVGLIASGVSIIIKVKASLGATLLGAMILTWFVILHMPRIVTAPVDDRRGEIDSACLALAYGGIAWVIAGSAKKEPFNKADV
jgi:uncharacterized membrane protein